MDETTTTYTVTSGDTLWKIAEKFLGDGALYKNIMDLNGLTSTSISPGQVLKIAGNITTAADSDELEFLKTLKTAIDGRIQKLEGNTQ